MLPSENLGEFVATETSRLAKVLCNSSAVTTEPLIKFSHHVVIMTTLQSINTVYEPCSSPYFLHVQKNFILLIILLGKLRMLFMQILDQMKDQRLDKHMYLF